MLVLGILMLGVAGVAGFMLLIPPKDPGAGAGGRRECLLGYHASSDRPSRSDSRRETIGHQYAGGGFRPHYSVTGGNPSQIRGEQRR